MKGDAAYAKRLAEDELGMLADNGSGEIINFEEAIAVPRIKHTAGLLRFWWDADQIQVAVSRTHCHKDGRVTGEVKITTTAPGFRSHLHQTQINFTATRSKQELAKHLGTLMNDVDWLDVIETVAQETIDRLREGEPVVEISTDDDVTPPDYLVERIIPENQPTVIYGPGGIGKSMFALLCGMSIQLPWENNALNLKIAKRVPVMYLDWETDSPDISWRMKCLRNGMNMPFVSIHYRRCALPLADDTEAIQRAILDKNIGFVVIDSVGAACGGDLNSAEPAIRMFTALRELKVTSLLVAHTSKNPATKETTVYGSAFFNFYARSVWEVKAVQEAGERCVKIGMYHKKANLSELFLPLGFRMDFGKGFTKFSPQEIAKVSQFAKELPVKKRIISALIEQGKMTVKELALALGTTEATVRDAMNDLYADKQVQNEAIGKEKHWWAVYDA